MPELIMIQGFAQQLAAFDVALPAKATAALDIWRAANTAVADSPADQIRADFEAGTITAANVNKKIQDAAASLAASSLAQELTRELIHPIAAAASRDVGEQADDIIRSLRPAWDQAAAGVAEAAKHFVAQATPAEILDGTPEAATAAQTLKRHRAILDAIAGIRRSLSTFGYGRGLPPDVAMFISTAASSEQLAQAEELMRHDEGLGGRWLHLTSGGFTLTLNTAAESTALIDSAHSATSAAQAAARERRNAAHAKTWRLPDPMSAA